PARPAWRPAPPADLRPPRSAGRAAQRQPFLLRQPAPHPEAHVVRQGVLEAGGPDGAHPADPLGVADRAAGLGEEEVSPGLCAERLLLPGEVGRRECFGVHGQKRSARRETSAQRAINGPLDAGHARGRPRWRDTVRAVGCGPFRRGRRTGDGPAGAARRTRPGRGGSESIVASSRPGSTAARGAVPAGAGGRIRRTVSPAAQGACPGGVPGGRARGACTDHGRIRPCCPAGPTPTGSGSWTPCPPTRRPPAGPPSPTPPAPLPRPGGVRPHCGVPVAVRGVLPAGRDAAGGRRSTARVLTRGVADRRELPTRSLLPRVPPEHGEHRAVRVL